MRTKSFVKACQLPHSYSCSGILAGDADLQRLVHGLHQPLFQILSERLIGGMP
jgi:hypothetical protein